MRVLFICAAPAMSCSNGLIYSLVRPGTNMDSATEYEKNAHEYLCDRDESLVGYKVVRQWANSLPAGSEVIEIACGGGYPVTKELSEAGLNLWAIDSSKTLLTEFKKRFPNVQVKCERVSRH